MIKIICHYFESINVKVLQFKEKFNWDVIIHILHSTSLEIWLQCCAQWRTQPGQAAKPIVYCHLYFYSSAKCDRASSYLTQFGCSSRWTIYIKYILESGDRDWKSPNIWKREREICLTLTKTIFCNFICKRIKINNSTVILVMQARIEHSFVNV